MSVKKLTLLICDEPKCNVHFGGGTGGVGDLNVEDLQEESITMGWVRLDTEWGTLYFDGLACTAKWIRANRAEPWKFFELPDQGWGNV